MQPVVKAYSNVPMMALKDRKSFIKAIRTAKRVASGKRAGAACAACKKSRLNSINVGIDFCFIQQSNLSPMNCIIINRLSSIILYKS
jgi:hypothetical protein